MTNKSKKGFTIIEVVLVLAIAGLIFLMVFIALPNMQRSQRDTQRRNDYSALSANMTQFMTNNSGNLPKAGNLAASTYINNDGKDPNGNDYALSVKVLNSGTNATELSAIPDKNTASTVVVYVNADCSDTSSDGRAKPKYNKSKRSFAIYGNLETGTYCQASN